ncbi:MAG: ral secretion pathway protein [Candidatus Kaiserbacteria bacterium]|nr:ral secretion pathway protein [Candidatus Kaiserbacteria bacterium]
MADTPSQSDQKGASTVRQSGVPMRSIGDESIPYDVLRYIPEESAEHYKIAPLATTLEGVLEVGMVDPEDMNAADALNFIARATGMPFKVFQISQEDFQKIITKYRGLGGDVDRAVSEMQTEQTTTKKSESTKKDEAVFGLENTPLDLDDPTIMVHRDGSANKNIQEDAPAIKIVSTILRYAIDGKASDIHIEPQSNGVRVRYRVDGDLHTSVLLPTNTHRAITARVKVLASLRLDETRKPQDGRFSASIDSRPIDFRVSTFPTYNGEKIVMRILDRDQGFRTLDKIGLTKRNEMLMKKAIERPHGLILVSGPTGSGKSSTLYSMLASIDREHKNILSLEDPVEYYMDGVAQSQVRPEIGYTFATGLRTTLRQDPDVIMVGEIRDGETAQLAIQAALTGHLVLSTIHTNDSVGTISRLINMGVEPYLIPPVLILSIAQRLMRTLAPGSGKETPLSPSDRKLIELQTASLPQEFHFPIQEHTYTPEPSEGYPTGMKGRMAVFEVLEMSSHLENIILTNPVDSELFAAARKQGMHTMFEDALLKSFDKKIPFTEVESLSNSKLEDDPVIEEVVDPQVVHA